MKLIYFYIDFIPGSYDIIYSVQDQNNNSTTKVRKILVKDTLKPTIQLNGPSEIDILKGDTYVEYGATAMDNVDNDISNQVKIKGDIIDTTKIGHYRLAYYVEDSSKNISDLVFRKINVSEIVIEDKTKPVVTLNGPSLINLIVGETYVEYGASAKDNDNTDLTKQIEIIGNKVNTGVPGYYALSYIVTDSNKNTSYPVIRTIIVKEKEIVIDNTKPIIRLNGPEKIVLMKGNTYQELGATATDNVNQDITDKIVISGGNVNTNIAGYYLIKYSVTDNFGNVADPLHRLVVIQEEPNIKYVDKIIETVKIVEKPVIEYVDKVVEKVKIVEKIVEKPITRIVEKIVEKPVIVETDRIRPKIQLNGESTIVLNVGEEYVERGAIANDNLENDITDKIIIEGDVNSNKIGFYLVKYIITDSVGNMAQKIRKIIVKDQNKPIITLMGSENMIHKYGEQFEDPGVICRDNNDKDISDRLIISNPIRNNTPPGEYFIRYNLIDSNGNKADTLTRRIIIQDEIKPVIILKGDKKVNLKYGDSYVDPVGLAFDNHDGDISDSIQISQTITSTTPPGNYVISYNVVDSSSNKADEVYREISVYKDKPIIRLIGPNKVKITKDKQYNDQGAIVDDIEIFGFTNNINDTNKLIIKGNNKKRKDDKYEIRYNYKDIFGIEADEVIREIEITNKNNNTLAIVSSIIFGIISIISILLYLIL